MYQMVAELAAGAGCLSISIRKSKLSIFFPDECDYRRRHADELATGDVFYLASTFARRRNYREYTRARYLQPAKG